MPDVNVRTRSYIHVAAYRHFKSNKSEWMKDRLLLLKSYTVAFLRGFLILRSYLEKHLALFLHMVARSPPSLQFARPTVTRIAQPTATTNGKKNPARTFIVKFIYRNQGRNKDGSKIRNLRFIPLTCSNKSINN